MPVILLIVCAWVVVLIVALCICVAGGHADAVTDAEQLAVVAEHRGMRRDSLASR